MNDSLQQGASGVREWIFAHRFLAAYISIIAFVIVLSTVFWVSSRNQTDNIRILVADNHQLSVENTHRIKDIQDLRKARSRLVAASDLELCTKLYGQIESVDKAQLAQTNARYIHRILPSLPIKDVESLVRTNRAQIKKNIKNFDPAQCHDLPTQALLPPSGK